MVSKLVSPMTLGVRKLCEIDHGPSCLRGTFAGDIAAVEPHHKLHWDAEKIDRVLDCSRRKATGPGLERQEGCGVNPSCFLGLLGKEVESKSLKTSEPEHLLTHDP